MRECWRVLEIPLSSCSLRRWKGGLFLSWSMSEVLRAHVTWGPRIGALCDFLAHLFRWSQGCYAGRPIKSSFRSPHVFVSWVMPLAPATQNAGINAPAPSRANAIRLLPHPSCAPGGLTLTGHVFEACDIWVFCLDQASGRRGLSSWGGVSLSASPWHWLRSPTVPAC